MSRKILVLEEVVAILQTMQVDPDIVAKFAEHAEVLIGGKGTRGPDDNLEVSSGYGVKSKRGFVELVVNETLTQMEAAKAREVGMMLLQASEAAIADETFVLFIRTKVGIEDEEKISLMLLDLRQLRQGTRGTSRPS